MTIHSMPGGRPLRNRPELLMAVLAFLLATAVPSTAGDFQVFVGDVTVDDTFVRTSFELSDPLPASDVEGPVQSPPAALAFTLELWRDRSGWFDGLVSSRTYGYRLEYDHWRAVYRVALPGGAFAETSSREDVIAILCRQMQVPGGLVAQLKTGKTYYISVTARLTPIDINKLSEVESWLSGEFRTGTRRGGVLGVPRAVVGILADVAGFGDQSTVGRSGRFRLSEDGMSLITVPE
jgi:hypothetical protein